MDLDDARKLIDLGRTAEAERLYLKLSAEPSLRAKAFYGLGFIAWRNQDFDAAQSWFTKCLKEDQNDLNARYFLGDIAARRGDVERAIRRYAEVLAHDPGHVGALIGIKNVNTSPVQQAVRSTSAAAQMPPRQAPAPPPNRQPPAPAPQPSPPAETLGRAPQPSSRRSIVGRARLVKLQAVAFNGTPAAKQSLTFRLDVPDEEGNLARSMGVEMRGFRISGGVENGDWVEIKEMSRSGTVRSLENLTTKQHVKSGLLF